MKAFGKDCERSIPTPWGEFAWRAEDFSFVEQAVRELNGIILGGDVLTTEMSYTYDNWCFDPVWDVTTNFKAACQDNAEESIRKAKEFVLAYVKDHGNDYLFVFVVCPESEIINYFKLV